MKHYIRFRTSIRSGIFGVLFILVAAGCGGKDAGLHTKPLAPKFPKYATWLNSEGYSQKLFQEKVTLVYFWDYTSLNCLRDMPMLKKLQDQYFAYGFRVVLVHAPEFEFASQKENVQQALQRYKITFPTILDNQFKLWEAYKVYSWPTRVLVDGNGRIAWAQIGEGKYIEFETELRRQLERLNYSMVLPSRIALVEPPIYDEEQCGFMSGETYMGYKRVNWWGGGIANKKWIKPNQIGTFRDRGDRIQKGFFLHGVWANEQDAFRHARETETASDYLGMAYWGNQVYSVLSQRQAPSKESLVYVTRDGSAVPEEKRGSDLQVDEEGRTYFVLAESRLYHLISNEDEGEHEIKLWPTNQDVSVNSFSFANRCLAQTDFLSGG